MSDKTGIGWTNATWNPVTGCSRVSPGCEHCYAETLSLRMGWSKKPWTNQNAAENVKLHPERLSAPSRWREPRLIFVNSMSDLFHPLVPFEYVDKVWEVIAATPRHTYQVLTKRPERMLQYFGGALLKENILPNLWLGVSVEDQRRADERIPLLVRTPAALRFLSCEPLLGSIDLTAWVRPYSVAGICFSTVPSRPVGATIVIHYDLIHWVIVGGESGPDVRPMRPAWAEQIAADCAAANVAVYVKQDSGPRPGKQGRLSDALWARKEYPVARVSL